MIKLRFLFLFIFLVFFCKAQKDEDIDKKINFVNYTEIGLVQNSNFINNSLRYSFQTINGVVRISVYPCQCFRSHGCH